MSTIRRQVTHIPRSSRGDGAPGTNYEERPALVVTIAFSIVGVIGDYFLKLPAKLRAREERSFT